MAAAATTAGAAVAELAAGQRVAACVAAAGEVMGWAAAAVAVVVAAMGPAVSWVAATNQWVSWAGVGWVGDRADRPAVAAVVAMGLVILAAAAVAVAAMGVGPLAARVVARGVEVATAMVVVAATALEVAVERAAAKRVEAVGTRGRRGGGSRLESPWMTCQAELTSAARRRARKARIAFGVFFARWFRDFTCPRALLASALAATVAPFAPAGSHSRRSLGQSAVQQFDNNTTVRRPATPRL